MSAPDILFATIAAGGSHVSSCQAMAEAVEAVAPGKFRLARREIMRDYGFTEFDDAHKRNWPRALEHPWTVVWGQRFIDQTPRLWQMFNRRMLLRFSRKAAEVLAADPPKLVVANHPWLCTALTQAQRKLGLAVPVLTFQTTTLDVTSLWAVRDVQRMFMGSPVARDLLAEMGVPRERMDVVGYPVRQGFLVRAPKAESRQRLGLEPDGFVVLVALGGEGVGGSPIQAIRALRALDQPVQQVVVTGRNDALRKAVEAEVQGDPLVRIEGFVDNMWDFMSAADVVVGKTGPASAMEALSQGRPLIATASSGGNENRIRQWLENHGVGHFAPDAATLRQVIPSYRHCPIRLAEVERISARWDFAEMADRVGRYIVHFADTGRPDHRLCGVGVG